MFGQAESSNHLNEQKNKLEFLRPYLNYVIGDSYTNDLLGNIKAKEVQLEFPDLPRIIKNPKSTTLYSKKKDNLKVPQKTEEKFFKTFVNEIYQATLIRRPTDIELNEKLNILFQGGKKEGIYHSLVLSQNYLELENLKIEIKKNELEFIKNLFLKYFGKKITLESIKEMNPYSLKRILSDKIIETCDAYELEGKRNELELWYAFFSSDLSVKFNNVWNSSIRKSFDLRVHKKWAEKMPVEYIKSELIIKLHSSLNMLIGV